MQNAMVVEGNGNDEQLELNSCMPATVSSSSPQPLEGEKEERGNGRWGKKIIKGREKKGEKSNKKRSEWPTSKVQSLRSLYAGKVYKSQRLKGWVEFCLSSRLSSVSGTPRGQMGLTFGRAVRGVGGPLAAGHRIRRTLESVPCTR